MKKFLSFMVFAMMAVFGLSLVSCGDDDEDFEASIVGTWEVTYVKATSAYGLDEDDGFEIGDRMTFYSNGTYEDSEDIGSWSKDGNTLTIFLDDDDDVISIPAVMKIKKLTETVLEVKLDYGGILQFEIKMKRVK